MSNEKETAIAACADVAALAEYVTGAEYSRWEALPLSPPLNLNQLQSRKRHSYRNTR